MAAPTVQSRSTLATIAMQHLTTTFGAIRFTFGLLPAFKIQEFEIMMGGVDGGEMIDQTTFFNAVYSSQLPQTLLKGMPFTIKGQFDPAVFGASQIPAIANRNQACTFLFPNLDTLSFFGAPNKFSFPTAFKKGNEVPTIEINIEQTQWDPVNRAVAGRLFTDNSSGTSDS